MTEQAEGYFIEQLDSSGMYVVGLQKPKDHPWEDHKWLGRDYTGKFGWYNTPFGMNMSRFATRRAAEKFLHEYLTREGDGQNLGKNREILDHRELIGVGPEIEPAADLDDDLQEAQSAARWSWGIAILASSAGSMMFGFWLRGYFPS